MKRLSAALLAFALCVPATSWAFGLSYGVRAGAGLAFPNDDAVPGDDASVTPFAAGLGINLDLALIDIEVDALYWHRSITYETTEAMKTVEKEASEGRLALPVLVRVGIPLVPLLSVGAGIEPRFLLSAEANDTDVSDNFESMALYVPILLAVDLDLSILELRVDLRYEFKLTNFLATSDDDANDNARMHELMLFAGLFF